MFYWSSWLLMCNIMKMELDLTQAKTSVPEVDVNVDYTKRILFALKSKVKEHNDTNESKVSVHQLKSVFITGAGDKIEGKKLILLGFARINMYLRLLDPAIAAREFKTASDNKHFKKLIFDFSSYVSPKAEDFSKAEDDLNKHNLNFDFAFVDELYLEDVQSVSFYKNYL
jgi:hypothetical protein